MGYWANQKALSFSRCLPFSELLFLLLCLFFLSKQIASMYSTLLKIYKGRVWGGPGVQGPAVWIWKAWNLLFRRSCPEIDGWACLHVVTMPHLMYSSSDPAFKWADTKDPDSRVGNGVASRCLVFDMSMHILRMGLVANVGWFKNLSELTN